MSAPTITDLGQLEAAYARAEQLRQEAAEGTTPQRIKTAYLTDDQATRIGDHAARLRTRAAITEGMQDSEGAA